LHAGGVGRAGVSAPRHTENLKTLDGRLKAAKH
jgi:hypothetical protein